MTHGGSDYSIEKKDGWRLRDARGRSLHEESELANTPWRYGRAVTPRAQPTHGSVNRHPSRECG